MFYPTINSAGEAIVKSTVEGIFAMYLFSFRRLPFSPEEWAKDGRLVGHALVRGCLLTYVRDSEGRVTVQGPIALNREKAEAGEAGAVLFQPDGDGVNWSVVGEVPKKPLEDGFVVCRAFGNSTKTHEWVVADAAGNCGYLVAPFSDASLFHKGGAVNLGSVLIRDDEGGTVGIAYAERYSYRSHQAVNLWLERWAGEPAGNVLRRNLLDKEVKPGLVLLREKRAGADWFIAARSQIEQLEAEGRVKETRASSKGAPAASSKQQHRERHDAGKPKGTTKSVEGPKKPTPNVIGKPVLQKKGVEPEVQKPAAPVEGGDASTEAKGVEAPESGGSTAVETLPADVKEPLKLGGYPSGTVGAALEKAARKKGKRLEDLVPETPTKH